MPEMVRAYCVVCKRMVSDDIFKTESGSVNRHEHPVVIMVERGMVESGDTIAAFMEMTPEAYLTYASQLDAELIVGRIKAKYNIPFGEKIITDIVSLIFKSLRELAIEEEEKDRMKANIRNKLTAGKKAQQKKTKVKKPRDGPLA